MKHKSAIKSKTNWLAIGSMWAIYWVPEVRRLYCENTEATVVGFAALVLLARNIRSNTKLTDK